MWQPYLKVIAEQIGQAVHRLDRHIMKKMGEAIDKVRRAESKRLERVGYEPVFDDGVKDKLEGGSGLDWFFADRDGVHGDDKVQDPKTNEQLIDLLVDLL